ncbi:MAG: SDR family oxidoreductase [Candidatus Lokiarchaeota archaeon]|nr:SDR family oxidoreductase [Candidatus Lokiarchaeota archaeon]
MNLLLENRVIIVTGGSKGLGFACAQSLAEEKAKVIISSRSRENLKKAQEKIENKTNKKVDYIPCDVSENEDVKHLKKLAVNKYKKIDGILINGGGPPTGRAIEFSEEQWDEAFQTNLMSAVRLTREFVPIMKQKRFGRIVAITSVSAKMPLPNLVLSNSMRLGVIGFLKTLSNECGADNILVNAVLPGTMTTTRLKNIISKWAEKEGKSVEKVINERTNTIALGRFGKPEELASIVTYLLSPKNSYITGQAITVDGGYNPSIF